MARTKTKLTQSEKVTSTNATVFFEDNSLPSSKLKDFKADGNVTWSSDLHIPSAKAIFAWAGSLFVKLANKITSWSATPSNDNVPSEKLVKDSLDAKVTGATSSTDNAIPRFDGSTGKIIQNSAVFIDDNDRVHFSEKAVNGMLVWPAIYDVSAKRKLRNMFMNSGDLLVNATERGMTISANRDPDNGHDKLPNVFKNTGAGVKPRWSDVSPANPVIITIENIPNVHTYKMLLVPGYRNSMPVDYSLELWSIYPSYGVNGYAKLVDVTGDTTTYLKILDTQYWEGVYKIVLTVTESGDADQSGYFYLDNIILYERYIGHGRFTGYNMSACGDTVYGDYRFNGNMGINTVPVKPLDVNGMAVFRDHVNLRHTKYIYLSTSPLEDAVNDIRISNNNGIYKIEKCTVANATKGSGTWIDIIIGDVVGPSSATANAIPLFDGATGKIIKDSGKKLSDYQTVVSEVAISSGNTYVMSNNTEYRAAAAITTITFTAPASGNYECYVRFTTASTGTISVSFPNGIKGNPVIGNSETWEFSCKDGYTLAIQLS